MTKTRRTAGFSLLEVAIAMAILGIVLAMIYMTLFSSSAEYEANAKRAWIIHQGRVALDEMVEDVRQSNRFSLTPLTPPATMISFKKVKKPLADGTAQYTANWITYRTMKADKATSNVTDPVTGISHKVGGAVWVDANNNTVDTDDYRLVRIDPNLGDDGMTYTTRIMCNYLKPDPDGFKITQTSVSVDGSLQWQVKISLTLVFTDVKNRQLEQTLETTVFLRNSQ